MRDYCVSFLERTAYHSKTFVSYPLADGKAPISTYIILHWTSLCKIYKKSYTTAPLQRTISYNTGHSRTQDSHRLVLGKTFNVL